MNKVVIIDYGMGNLNSVQRAFEECGATVQVSSYHKDLESATHIVLPGVGSFADGMKNLKKQNLVSSLKDKVLRENTPLLGICLGMQLLSDKGYEGEETEGLKLIPGVVRRLESNHDRERIPHIGWNEVHIRKESKLFDGISNKSDFYFVHSFHFNPFNKESIVATTPYCNKFISVINQKNIYGVQFHPEKSQRFGFDLIRNFLEL
jgi:glutamine amidotransferase